MPSTVLLSDKTLAKPEATLQVVVRLFSLHRTREHKPVDISIQVFEAAFNLLFVIL